MRAAEIDERTATRDLSRLSEVGLLRPVGQTKGRYYLAGPALADVVAVRRAKGPLVDPYPNLRAGPYLPGDA